MNYLTLAMRIKCKDAGQFENHLTWLNTIYYSFGALSVCIPILRAAFFISNPTVSNWFGLSMSVFFIFTAAMMIVALVVISRVLDAEARVVVNFKEVSLHIFAFSMFALDNICVSIIEIVMYNNDWYGPNE